MSNEHAKLIDQFVEFEAAQGLFDLELQGIKIWPYLRFGIYSKIKKKLFGLADAHYSKKNNSKLMRLGAIIKLLPDIILKNPFIYLREKDVIVFNHQRRVKNGEFYDCIYTDQILNEFPCSYYVFEALYHGSHYKPIRTSSVKYLDYIDLRNAILREVYRLAGIKVLTKEDKDKVRKLVKKINNKFEVKLCPEGYIRTVQRVIHNNYLYKIAYEHIIKKVKPKLFIEVYYYSSKCMAMNELTKKYSIKSIELQHGVMGRGHVAYNYKTRKQPSAFPDHLFLFGEYWKDTTRLPIEESNIHVTGFPYYESKIEDLKNSKDDKQDQKITILFVSQGPIGESLSRIAVDLSGLIQKKLFLIIYKLHPGEYYNWSNRYPWLADDEVDIEVVHDNKRDIYHFLNLADYQIGVNSTTLYEGLGFNLRTFIVKLPGWEAMEDLTKMKYAELVTSASEIADLVKNDEGLSSITKNKNVNDYFWKKDSLKNILEAIIKLQMIDAI